MKLRIALAALLLPAGPALAQLALPSVGEPLGNVTGAVDGVVGTALQPVESAAQGANELARQRLDRLAEFVRRNRAEVELDSNRQPARRGELLVTDIDDQALSIGKNAGFEVVEQGEIEGLGIGFARLSIPPHVSLADAEGRLRRLLPSAQVGSNPIHFPSGGQAGSAVRASSYQKTLPRGGTVGIIDGGVVATRPLAGQRGFAVGAPRANAHATQIASLLAGAGTGRIYAADVYGSDPAGGDAFAIARALGWMVQERVPVVSISLVGPANPLLARAVAAAGARGVIVVAAVGNDGVGAPPAYPASYPGVIAVTGIDGRGRVLIEAGRANHLDYAAPGAGITALGIDGKRVSLRGTSFAAPLAAARIAAQRVQGRAAVLAATDAEAVGPGPRKGRGVLCDLCRTGM